VEMIVILLCAQPCHHSIELTLKSGIFIIKKVY